VKFGSVHGRERRMCLGDLEIRDLVVRELLLAATSSWLLPFCNFKYAEKCFCAVGLKGTDMIPIFRSFSGES